MIKDQQSLFFFLIFFPFPFLFFFPFFSFLFPLHALTHTYIQKHIYTVASLQSTWVPFDIVNDFDVGKDRVINMCRLDERYNYL